MGHHFSAEQLRQTRLSRQLLNDTDRASSAADIARALFALQAQEWPSAQLALHARARGITQADVIHAREVERAFVLTWSLRGTLHLVAAEDVRWQLDLCGPPAIRGTRSRYKQLGLTDDIRERALGAIEDILRGDNALTRAQLAEALASRGIPVAGQAIHHLARFAALRGLICFGPEINGDLTYALLDEWAPADGAKPNADEALRQFALRYLAAHGPATLADFQRWSGLTAAQAKQAWAVIESECVPIALPEGEALLLERHLEQLEAPPDEPTVRLLPRYDNYLLGYESRAFMVDAAYAKQVHPGGGLIRACVIIDGEAKANWKLEKRGARQRLVVDPFEKLEAGQLELLEAEARSLGSFFETSLELRVASG